MSTDLVKASSGGMRSADLVKIIESQVGESEHVAAAVAAIQAVEQELDQLIAAGDTEALYDGAVRVDAAKLYERRNGYSDLAAHYAKLRFKIEAAIGAIDIRNHPKLALGENRALPPLAIGATTVSGTRRNFWRQWAVLAERNLLDSILDALMARDDMTAKALNAEAARQGALWVPTDLLAQAAKTRGLSGAEIARRTGLSETLVSRHISTRAARSQRFQPRVRWLSSKPVVEAIGLDPCTLPPAPPTATSARAMRQSRERAARAALRKQEREREIKAAVKKHGGDLAEAYALASQLDNILGRARRAATDREQRVAISEAHALRDKMMDAIVRALGVA